MKKSKNNPIFREIKRKAKSAGITQTDISKALNLSQSQVSRLMSGNFIKDEKFVDLCIYVNRFYKHLSKEDVAANEVIMNALVEVWDGSISQANSIASVIRALKPLCHISVIKNGL